MSRTTAPVPSHVEGLPSGESAPLLGPSASAASDAAQLRSSGTFLGSNATGDGSDIGNGRSSITTDRIAARRDGNADADAAATPKIEANMAALFPALAIGVFMVALDQTLTIATYGRIGSDLHALNSASWIATSYFLTLTTLQPLYGKLCDIFGRKACLLFAYLVFGIGCLGCGLAQDIVQLCVSRAVAGIGGGGMNAVVTILVTDLVSLRNRGVWQGYINGMYENPHIVFSSGLAAGAPIGGLLADTIGWRWAFLVQFPVSILAWIAVFFALKLPPTEASHWTAKVLRIDFLGALTLVSAVFTLLYGLDNGSNEGWSRKVTVFPLAITPVLFLVFLFVENKVASHPFAPGHVILDPALMAAYGANFFGVAAQMGSLFFIALFFQAAMGLSAAQSGLAFLPSTFFGLAGSLGGGHIIRHTGRYYWITVSGVTFLLLSVVPFVLFTGAVAKSVPGVIIGGLCLMALGCGLFITTTLIALIANAAPEDTAVTIACSYLFRSLGTTLGISITTATLQQVLRITLSSRLPEDSDADEIADRVRESLDFIRDRLDPDVAAIVRECYAVATQAAFVPVALLAVFALISAAFIREMKLER